MEVEGPAIRALGSLFKLTEAYIWEEDDGSTVTREVCLFPESSSIYSQDYDCTDSSLTALTSDFNEAPEDVELTKHMDALGLPISFQSNKEMRSNKKNKSKRKGNRLKKLAHEVEDEDALEFTKLSEVEILSPTPTPLHDNITNSLSSMSMLGPSELCYCDVAVDICSQSRCLADEDSASSTKILCNAVFDHDLSNNGQECQSVTLHDVALSDENKGLRSSNSDAPPSPPCQLMVKSVDDDDKELGGSLESECVEDFSAAHHHEKVSSCSEECADQAGVSEIVDLSQKIECNRIESHGCNDNFGYWRVYWDTYYLRNYFYNIQTFTSTWDPPAGMEHLAFDCITDGSNEIIAEVAENDDGPSASCDLLNYFESSEECPDDNRLVDQPSDKASKGMGIIAKSTLPGVPLPETNRFEFQDELQGIKTSCYDEVTSHLSLDDAQENFNSMINQQVSEDDNMRIEFGDPATNALDIQLEPGMTKQKKKARKTVAHGKSSNADLRCQEIFENCSANIGKYWHQRYLLFSRFDSGVRMDEEGWFSVTPEPIAKHQALRCASDVIIDCFTGVGGNAIQFAQRCKHVTAIDVDPKKINYACHNASIYGVDDRIDFIVGDFFVLAPRLKADTVFLSPPWGGPSYAKVKTYNIMTMLRPQDGCSLFNAARKIAHRIVMFLPKNVDLNQLAELTLSAGHQWSLEVEKNYLNGKLKAITAYFRDTTVEDTNSP